MFYLGIDQHAKQLTICLRDEQGEVVRQRQVSTKWEKFEEFFNKLSQRCQSEGGYVAIVEVCGFNDWLLERLPKYGCGEIVLVQPTGKPKRKTDRRDASSLSEVLWVNRDKLLGGRRLSGLRRVEIATASQRDDRRLTAMRHNMARARTRLINGVKHILRRHNLTQDCPTKGIQTKGARKWLDELELGAIDRLEMDQLLAGWDLCEQHLATLNERIVERSRAHETAPLLSTAPGCGPLTSLALACRIGSIDRFPRPRSLANYFGLTPGCRNSGQSVRPGSITKQGSKLARFLLGQMVLHALRRDSAMRHWYKRIRGRRGSKIARVAVMRRLTTILWHMLKKGESYQYCRPEKPAGTDQPGGSRTSNSKAARRAAEQAERAAAIREEFLSKK